MASTTGLVRLRGISVVVVLRERDVPWYMALFFSGFGSERSKEDRIVSELEGFVG